jgi:hypothetical protein
LCGLLANKTRIIATHQLHYLSHPAVTKIVMMGGDGRISAVGSYAELAGRGLLPQLSENTLGNTNALLNDAAEVVESCILQKSVSCGDNTSNAADVGKLFETSVDKAGEGGANEDSANKEFTEQIQHGTIRIRHMLTYVVAAGGWVTVLSSLFFCGAYVAGNVGLTMWVAHWKNAVKNNVNSSAAVTSPSSNYASVVGYGVFGLGMMALDLCQRLNGLRFMIRAATVLHERMLRTVC